MRSHFKVRNPKQMVGSNNLNDHSIQTGGLKQCEVLKCSQNLKTMNGTPWFCTPVMVYN